MSDRDLGAGVDPAPRGAVPVPLPELAGGSIREQVDPDVAAVGAPPIASQNGGDAPADALAGVDPGPGRAVPVALPQVPVGAAHEQVDPDAGRIRAPGAAANQCDRLVADGLAGVHPGPGGTV